MARGEHRGPQPISQAPTQSEYVNHARCLDSAVRWHTQHTGRIRTLGVPSARARLSLQFTWVCATALATLFVRNGLPRSKGNPKSFKKKKIVSERKSRRVQRGNSFPSSRPTNNLSKVGSGLSSNPSPKLMLTPARAPFLALGIHFLTALVEEQDCRYRKPCSPRLGDPALGTTFWPDTGTARPVGHRAWAGTARRTRPCLGRQSSLRAGTARHGI
jgi:hypothetical protein